VSEFFRPYGPLLHKVHSVHSDRPPFQPHTWMVFHLGPLRSSKSTMVPFLSLHVDATVKSIVIIGLFDVRWILKVACS
jgi:hypothetical protein